MKKLLCLFLGATLLSSCKKEGSIDPNSIPSEENVANKKLSLIVLNWIDKGNNIPVEGSIYYKITYDTANNKIFMDSDSTNGAHEYVYEYNNLGQLVKCQYLDAMHDNQSMTFTYTRTANALTISSNSQGIIEERVYNKTAIPGGYRYLQTVPNPSGSDYILFDFTNQHIPMQSIHFDGPINDPYWYDKRVYKFDNNLNFISEKFYNSPNGPEVESDSAVRGNGSTKLLYNFIKKLKGTDLLYFWGYDIDNFLGLEPERLGIFLFFEENYSDKEFLGAFPVDPQVIKNTFYNFGEIKSTKLDIGEYQETRTYFYE